MQIREFLQCRNFPHRCREERSITMGRLQRTLTLPIYISSLLAAVVLWPIPLVATNYTVKSGGGGNFTTVQACANAAVAGDTCTAYAGSYAGWTQKVSGSAGSPITFTVNPGDSVTITSTVNVTSTNYITIGAPDAETIPTICTSRTIRAGARIQPSSCICRRAAWLGRDASHTSIRITTIITSRTTTLTGTSTIRRLLFVPTTFSSTDCAIFSSTTSYKELEPNISERAGHSTSFGTTTRTTTTAT